MTAVATARIMMRIQHREPGDVDVAIKLSLFLEEGHKTWSGISYGLIFGVTGGISECSQFYIHITEINSALNKRPVATIYILKRPYLRNSRIDHYLAV